MAKQKNHTTTVLQVTAFGSEAESRLFRFQRLEPDIPLSAQFEPCT